MTTMTTSQKAQNTRETKETRAYLNDLQESRRKGSSLHFGTSIFNWIHDMRTDLNKLRKDRAVAEYGEPVFTILDEEEIQINYMINGTAIGFDRVEGSEIYLVLGSDTYMIDIMTSDFGAWVQAERKNVFNRTTRIGPDDHTNVEEILDVQDYIVGHCDLEDDGHEWLNDLFREVDDVKAHVRILEKIAQKIEN